MLNMSEGLKVIQYGEEGRGASRIEVERPKMIGTAIGFSRKMHMLDLAASRTLCGLVPRGGLGFEPRNFSDFEQACKRCSRAVALQTAASIYMGSAR